jgi:hypothetical protein
VIELVTTACERMLAQNATVHQTLVLVGSSPRTLIGGVIDTFVSSIPRDPDPYEGVVDTFV